MLDLQECLCWDKTAKLPKLGANLPIQTLTETLGDLHRNTVATNTVAHQHISHQHSQPPQKHSRPPLGDLHRNTVAHQHTKTSATNTATSDKATLC